MPTVSIREKSYEFSVHIIRFLSGLRYHELKNPLRKQLIRSATSIGANIIEAQSSSSKREFLQYMQIALRSSKESEYWLRLLQEADPALTSTIQALASKNQSLSNILTAILIKGKLHNQSL
ncbi:MAG: four helix bundle protein [bacterium]